MMAAACPPVRLASRSEFVGVRGAQVHVRRWGNPEAPLLVLLHGWMDQSATFQFMVDALRGDWNVLAPDWPGSGRSDSVGGDPMTASWVADLDAFLALYTPCQPARLVAHSMGAQVGTLYCGLRPHRVAGLVNLDGLAPMPPEEPQAELDRLRRWLDHAADPRPARVVDGVATIASELMARNRRLTPGQAAYLAGQFTRALPDGRVELLVDPRQTRVGSVPRFPLGVINAALANFPGPMLWILGGRSPHAGMFARTPDGARLLEERFASAVQGRQVTLADAGHNVQHDEPHQVAAFVEEFFASKAVRARIGAGDH